MEVKQYITENKERFLKELFELLRIPSISADPTHKKDVKKAAQWLVDHISSLGVNKVVGFPTKGHPIIYGAYHINDNVPTVLVYGHYDVQPPDPLDLWDSPPFEPTIKKTKIHPQGAIFARGSCDDKGQLFMHLKAFEFLQKEGILNCNIKFLLEGEEEVGSVNLESFCKENKEMLSCDMILISDTSIIASDVPSITTGLRGLTYVEVEVTGPNRDLHSGVYGGAVTNPVNALAEMIAALRDENGKITIPGFYDKVEILSEEERKKMNEAPFDLENYKAGLGIDAVSGEKGFTSLERTTIRPTLDVNGIWGGYIGKGAKTVLPSKAYAKISMRLVPHQDPDEIQKLFDEYFHSIAPPGIKVKITPQHGGHPVVTPIGSKEYKAAAAAMQKTYQKEPIPARGGGSIPIVALFEHVLGAKSILMGFGLDSDDIHSPNEHYGIENFLKGIETISYFYKFYCS